MVRRGQHAHSKAKGLIPLMALACLTCDAPPSTRRAAPSTASRARTADAAARNTATAVTAVTAMAVQDDGPGRLERLYLQGATFLANQRGADAIGTLEQCIVLDPAFAKCYRVLGLAYSQRGEDDIAVAYYEKYLTLAPDAVDAPVVRHMLQAALQASGGTLEALE